MRAHLRPYHYMYRPPPHPVSLASDSPFWGPPKHGAECVWPCVANPYHARYTQGAAPARRAPVLGVCLTAQLEPPFLIVFRSSRPGGMGVCVWLVFWWKPSCLCGWLYGVGVMPVVPSFQTVPSADSCWCRVLSFPCCLFPSYQALQRVPLFPTSAGFRCSVAA
jgi:hypothetical protein